MAKVGGKILFERLFSSRAGRKSFFTALPFAWVMLFLSSAIGTILFAGIVASRLNDIGRSRWHATWLTLWTLIVVTVAEAHLPPGTTIAQHNAALGAIELPLFILLLVLGFFPGQKQPNRFGPVPLGLREFWGARTGARAYRKAYAKVRPQMESLAARQKACSDRVHALLHQLQERRAAGDHEAVKSLKAQFDQAVQDSKDAGARFKEVSSQLDPAREQWRKSRQRLSEILDHQSDQRDHPVQTDHRASISSGAV